MEASPKSPGKPIQPRPQGRPLRLGDLILIVAGVAIWLVIVREYGRVRRLPPGWYPILWSFRKYRLSGPGNAAFAFGLELASLTLLIARLGQPRPAWRRVWRQPGLLASAGAVVGMGIGLVGTVTIQAAATNGINPSLWPSLFDCFEGSMGCAAPGVLGAWIGLGLTGRWRADRSTIDRLGRLVGWLWLVEFVIAELLMAKWYSVIDNIWGWR